MQDTVFLLPHDLNNAQESLHCHAAYITILWFPAGYYLQKNKISKDKICCFQALS